MLICVYNAGSIKPNNRVEHERTHFFHIRAFKSQGSSSFEADLNRIWNNSPRRIQQPSSTPSPLQRRGPEYLLSSIDTTPNSAVSTGSLRAASCPLVLSRVVAPPRLGAATNGRLLLFTSAFSGLASQEEAVDRVEDQARKIRHRNCAAARASTSAVDRCQW